MWGWYGGLVLLSSIVLEVVVSAFTEANFVGDGGCGCGVCF